MAPLDLTPDNNANTEIPLPESFSARRFPVIGQHWFGLEPPRPWEPLAVPLARVIARLPVESERATPDEVPA